MARVRLASAAGALGVVWGAAAVRAGRWRVLTPRNALLVPVLLTIPWVLQALAPAPRIDPRGAPWTPPAAGDLFVTLSRAPAGAFVAGGVAVALGAAVARE